MTVCRRSAGVLDAWLEAGQVGDRDARHLAGCRRCADALSRVDVIDGEIRAAVRSLVSDASAVGIGPTAPERHASGRIAVEGFRPAKATVGWRAGLASLAGIVVLTVVVGIRMAATPAAPSASARPLLPVPVGPAEQALHQSGLRCSDIPTGLDCVRRLSDGWLQTARLEVAGATVQGLEVRLVPGTAAYPVADAPAALSEPATDVLGIDLSVAVDEAVDAGGVACGCTRSIDGGAIQVDGDPVAGYVLAIEVPD
jgi:hypothetical protein